MANFPTSVSTNSNLYIAVNGLQTTLAANITNSDTTIQLTSTTGFPTTGFVTIENNEVVSYTGVSGANLTGCTRGADGTTALAHNTGVTVGATIVAAHHNLLKDEVIAIETALGAGFAISNLTDAGTDGITITGGTGAVIGSGTSISQHVADGTHNGYLLSTDWGVFNAKQPAGSYITALTGDISAAGPGSAVATLPTVNSNVGTFTLATVTVNAKGQITAASTGTAGSGTVTNVSGTTNQITSTNPTTTPVLALSSTLQLPGTLKLGGQEDANSNKIVNLTNGSAAQDAAAFGQIPVFAAAVQSVQTSQFTTTSSTYQDTGLSATITPLSSSHRVKVTVAISGNLSSGDRLCATIFRGSTDLASSTAGLNSLQPGSGSFIDVPICMSFIDSPATASAVTYTVKIRNTGNSQLIGISGNNDGVIIVEEIV